MLKPGSFISGGKSKLVIFPATVNEMRLRGISTMALPLGYTAQTTNVPEMDVFIDKLLVTGGQYEQVQLTASFLGELTQTLFQQWAENNVPVTWARFYSDADHFAALNLIEDPLGYYSMATVSAPSADKAGVYTMNLSIAPAGKSVFFNAHTCPNLGGSLSFTAAVPGTTGAKVADSGAGFIKNGFKPGDICLIDWLAAHEPFYAQIDTVTAALITFVDDSEEGVEGSASEKITTISGVAGTQIHGARGASFWKTFGTVTGTSYCDSL